MRSETLLLRLVHPAHVHAGMITSQAFRPPTQSPLLTVFDATVTSPATVWAWSLDFFPQSRRFAGIVAVSLGECESLGLSVSEIQDHPEGHSVIDFTGLSRGQLRQAAVILKEFAAARGWIFRDETL